MKIKSLLGVVVLCCLWAIPAMAQYTPDPKDVTPPDSIIFIWTQPDLSQGITNITADLYFFNNPQMISSMSAAFKWDNPKFKIDSVTYTIVGMGAFDYFRMGLYKGSADTSNVYQYFQAVFARMYAGLPASTTPWRLATYWFHVEDWTESDTVAITLADFNAYAFVDAASNDEYAPIWGGDYVIQDVNRPEPKVLEVDPATLVFDAETGGSNPLPDDFLVTEASGQPLTYQATPSPTASWISLTNASGPAPGTVGVNVNIAGLAANTYVDSIHVTSADAVNNIWVKVTLNLAQGNQAPVLDPIGDQGFFENTPSSFLIHGSDPDGPVGEAWLTHTALPMGSNLTYQGSGTWMFMWTPGYDQAGQYPVTFTLFDGILTDEETITITVTDVNRRPVLSNIGNRQTYEGVPLQFLVTATDPDMDDLTLTANPSPGTEYFTDNGNGSGTFSWTPGNTDAGMYDVWFVASDGALADSELVTIEVIDADGFNLNPNPLVFVADYGDTDPLDDSFELSVSDASAILYMAEEDCPWFTINNASGTTPTNITVSVDPTGLAGGFYRDSIVISQVEPTTKSAEALEPVVEFVELTVNYNAVITPDTLYFVVSESALVTPPSQAISITEQGGANLDYVVASTPDSWVLLESDTLGTTPGTMMVTVSTYDLAPGIHYSFVPVEIQGVENGSKDVVVMVTVEPCPYFDQEMVVMGPTTIIAGGTAVLNESIDLTSIGDGEINWTTTIPGYFSFSPMNGTTPGTVEITYSRLFDAEGVFADTAYIEAVFDPEAVACTSSIMIIANVMVNRPPSADTVIVVSTPAVPGMRVGMPVIFTNSCALTELGLSLTWDGSLNLDSVSFVGSAVGYVNDKTVMLDDAAGTVSIVAAVGAQQMVPIGSKQLMATRWFALPCEIADSTSYLFSLGDELAMGSAYFLRDCGSGEIEPEYPEYLPGTLLVRTTPYSICGYVVDPFDDEIEGATVQVFEDYPFTLPLVSTTSSDIGSWAFDDLTVVPFDVYAYKEGYYPGKVEDLNFGDKGIKIVLVPLPETVRETSEWVDYYCPYFPESQNLYLGAPVPVGAVVEAYTPGGLLVGQEMVMEAGKYGFFPVYRANSQFGDPGAVTGDVIHFTINGMDAVADGNTVYPSEYMKMEVCLEVRGTVETECTLFEGWNLISWNVNTDTDDILTVLDPIMDYVDVVLGFERGGLTFDPDLLTFSTLRMVDHYSGYWVRIEGISEITLTVTGLPQDAASTTIQLYPGWNLVSYLPEESMTTEDALVYAGDIFEFAYGFPNGSIEVWQPGGQFNQLLSFDPCNGYWLKCNDYGLLRYSGIGIPASPETRPTTPSASLSASTEYATSNWVNLYSSNLQVNNRTVPAGATIKALTAENDDLVGSFTIRSDGQFGFMPVYASTSGQTTGLRAGDEFYLVVNDVVTQEVFTWTNNGDRIEVSSLSTASSIGDVLPQGYSLEQNYPNPFNPSTTITFQMPQASRVKIEVFNVLGRSIGVIYDGRAEAGENNVVWDGTDAAGNHTASGVYFYRMTADNYTETRKMMLLK